MSNKVSPHIWIPSSLIRTLFSPHLQDLVESQELSLKVLTGIINSLYAANPRIHTLFKLPKADQLATNLLARGGAYSEYYSEIYFILMDNFDQFKTRRITAQHVDLTITKLRAANVDIPLPKSDGDVVVTDLVERYVVESTLAVMLLAQRMGS